MGEPGQLRLPGRRRHLELANLRVPALGLAARPTTTPSLLEFDTTTKIFEKAAGMQKECSEASLKRRAPPAQLKRYLPGGTKPAGVGFQT